MLDEVTAMKLPPLSNIERAHVQGSSYVPPPVPATFNGKGGDVCTGPIDAHSVCMG